MSRRAWTGTVVLRPSGGDEPLVGAALAHLANSERGRRTGRAGMAAQTRTVWVPMNSPSIAGSPSSRIRATTSVRLALSSSSVAPWLWAPARPGA